MQFQERQGEERDDEKERVGEGRRGTVLVDSKGHPKACQLAEQVRKNLNYRNLSHFIT